jgi:hypothetical protein
MAEKVFKVRIRAPSRKALEDLPIAQMDTGCTGGIRTQADGSVTLEAYVRESVLQKIRESGHTMEVLADVEEESEKKRQQVGKGNRFEGANRIPRGIGKKVRE